MKNSSDGKPLISVVTPVYNGERFVQEAYDCLNRQTYTNWEWVVVDDGSTDDTLNRLRALAERDERVSVYTQPNSGSAKVPRDHAVYEAAGSLLVPFDIDDLLSDDYLELMLHRLQETDADMVYPQMLFIDLDTGKTTETLPVSDFDTQRIYEARQLVRETAPEWRIGCNGGIYRRETWINMSYPEKHEPVWMNSDEVDERLYLIHARRAAFCQARYYYRNHQTSITNAISPKQFHTLKTCLQLLDIAEREFGKDSEEYRRMQRRAFYDWRCKMKLFVTHYDALESAQDEVHLSLKACSERIDPQFLTWRERMQFLNFRHFGLLLVLFCLRYAPNVLGQKLTKRYCPNAYREKYARPRIEQKMRLQMAESYEQGQPLAHFEPHVVSMFCGNTESGGLVDRLRGAVSTYMVSQQCGRSFRLHFTFPFRLEDYLMPNDYDWRIPPDEVTFAKPQTAIILSETIDDSPAERLQQKQCLTDGMRRSGDRQTHVYSNAAFCYDQDFAKVFNHLFRPAPRLSLHLDSIRAEIGGAYMTFSARFCNLFDDFNEEVYSEPLLPTERDKLLSECMNQMGKVIARYPHLRPVVCSDSIRFINEARQHFDVYSIPGTISHIGNDGEHQYEYYEKTFLDFFTIYHAEHVCLLCGPRMMQSGFPRAAALAGGRPFELISF